MLFGFTLAAGAAQQSNQRGLSPLIGWLEQSELARMRESFLRYRLEAGDQRRQKPHAQPPRFLTFPDAPALELVAVREIETLQQVTVQHLDRLAQSIGRDAIEAVSRDAAHRVDVHRNSTEIELDVNAIGDDPSTVGLVDQRAQVAQAPPQGGTRIIRHVPEQAAETLSAVRARGDREVGQQGTRLF